MTSVVRSLDIIGAVFSFSSTALCVRAHLWAWPLGMVATVIEAVLYALVGIYGDMVLSGIYFVSMFYGWYSWTHHKGSAQPRPITHLSLRLSGILSMIAVLGIVGVAVLLKYLAHSQVPYLDAVTTVLSVLAQWMVCRKIIETWFLWFVVNILYVGLYFYKGIPVHSVLFGVYLIMAVMGYFHWRKLIQKTDQAVDPLAELPASS